MYVRNSSECNKIHGIMLGYTISERQSSVQHYAAMSCSLEQAALIGIMMNVS
jgi:hypothetical protein